MTQKCLRNARNARNGRPAPLMPEEVGQDPAILLVLASRPIAILTHSYPSRYSMFF